MGPSARLPALGMTLALALAPGDPAVAGPPRADWGMARARETPRAWLGVGVTEVESGVAETGRGPGVSLARVAPGGPAERAGLRPGDVLLALDGRVIEGAEALRAALAMRAPTDSVTLLVLRGSGAMTVTAELSAAPEVGAVRQVVPLAVPTPATGGGAPPADVELTFLGAMARADLGVETMDLEPGLARYFGVAEDGGVLVESVRDASAGARSGLRAGDVLLAVAGRAVSSGAELAGQLRLRSPGETIALTVLRAGRRFDIGATLAATEVPAWRLENPASPGGAAPTTALAEHEAREIARLEAVIRACRDKAGLAALLPEGDAEGVASELSARLHALQLERAALEARLQELKAAAAPRAAVPPEASSSSSPR